MGAQNGSPCSPLWWPHGKLGDVWGHLSALLGLNPRGKVECDWQLGQQRCQLCAPLAGGALLRLLLLRSVPQRLGLLHAVRHNDEVCSAECTGILFTRG